MEVNLKADVLNLLFMLRNNVFSSPGDGEISRPSSSPVPQPWTSPPRRDVASGHAKATREAKLPQIPSPSLHPNKQQPSSSLQGTIPFTSSLVGTPH